MSSVTRRTVLATGAAASVAAGLAGSARAGLGEPFLQRCASCAANLAMGDLHKADCQAIQLPPPDHDIKPATLKTAQATRRSSDPLRPSSRKKEPYGPPDPCPTHGCDRCRVQQSQKGISCLWKNKEQCRWQKAC